MTAIGKREKGRPAEGLEPKRAPLNLRTSPDLRRRIEASAASAGLSLTQEVERVLLRAYDGDDTLGPPDQAVFIRLIAAIMSLVQSNAGARWNEHFPAYEAVRTLVEAALEANRPPVPNVAALGVAIAAGRADLARGARDDELRARIDEIEKAAGPFEDARWEGRAIASDLAAILKLGLPEAKR